MDLVLHVTRFQLRAFLRNRKARMFTLVIPLILLALLAGVFHGVADTIDHQIPGHILRLYGGREGFAVAAVGGNCGYALFQWALAARDRPDLVPGRQRGAREACCGGEKGEQAGR